MIYTLTLNPALDRELLVPRLEVNLVLRALETRLDCGGKGFNVSRALRALGTESVALGFIGGSTGQALRRGLEDLCISTNFIELMGETRTNFSVVEAERRTYLKVNEPGPHVTAADLDRLVDLLRSLVRPGDWFVLSGSLPPGVPDDIYASLIHLLHASGARVALDTSGPALRLGCQAAPDLAKPNAFEIGEITGVPVTGVASAQQAAAQLLAQGVTMLVVSFGKDGALLFNGRHTWQAAPAAITEQNPIGAGDAMVAGLVYALSGGLSSADVLRWGMACGAAAASLPGTAMGDFELVSQLAARITPYSLA